MATLSGRTLNGNSGKQTYKYDGVINSTINAGAGNDVFRLNFARNSTLNGDAGNDNIKIEWQKSTNKVRVNGGAGNDTIDVDGSKSTVDGGAGNDSISVKGSNWSVSGGAGNDTIQLWGWDTNLTVSGGAGKDTFLLMGPRYNDAGKPITATWATITDLSAEDTLRFAINPEVARSPYYAKGKKNPFHGKDGKISSLTATRSGSTVTLKDSEYRVNLVLKNINDMSKLGSVKVFNGSKAKKATTLRNLVTLPKLPKGIATKGSQLVIGNTFKGTFDFGKYFSWAKNINASSSKQKLTIKGDVQNNVITAGSAASVLYGLDGNDKLTGGKAADKLYGGAGNDMMYANAGNDTLSGGAGNDEMYGDAGADFLNGGTGNDEMKGGAGNDKLYGDAGNDWLYGDYYVKYANGTWAPAGNGNDYLDGGVGNDNLYGNAGNDTLIGGVGNDTLIGDSYAMNGEAGNGNDYLDGGAGNDSLNGGAGNDTLIGGAGSNTLSGGAGKDVFRCGATDAKGNASTDYIEGYETGEVIEFMNKLTLESATSEENAFTCITLSNGSTITVNTMAGQSITYKQNGKTYTLKKKSGATASGSSGMIANSAPIVGTSSAQLASLVSTTQTGTPGGLTNMSLASTEASGSGLIAAGGTAPSNPLTNQRTA